MRPIQDTRQPIQARSSNCYGVIKKRVGSELLNEEDFRSERPDEIM